MGYTYQHWRCMCPHCYVVHCWGRSICGGMYGELCYLSWSDGVSCKNLVSYVWQSVFVQVPVEWGVKLSQILRDIKKQRGLSDYIYRKVHQTSAVAPKFYGLPKIHKTGTPLGPLFPVSSIQYTDSISYWVAKELANIIFPLVGHSPTPLQKHSTLCTTHQGSKAGTRGGH